MINSTIGVGTDHPDAKLCGNITPFHFNLPVTTEGIRAVSDTIRQKGQRLQTVERK